MEIDDNRQPTTAREVVKRTDRLQRRQQTVVRNRYCIDVAIATACSGLIAACLITAHNRLNFGGYLFWVSLVSILVAALILVVCLLDMLDGVVKTGGDYMNENQGTKTNTLMDRLRGREWFKLRGLPFYRRGALLCFIVLFLVAY